MTFRRTGNKRVQEVDESLQFCDHCDKQISVNDYRSIDHWEVRLDKETSYPDDDNQGYDLCSLECLSAWAKVTPLRRTKAGVSDAW